ncbi:MAG: YbhB/YbcL family Raf kinase inhibitor-like protein [Patescibacteria group bacterium]|nr:YbhB/YbcL family Raf kinase inhibitor-like protein [Patescibacteria group bacterium]
MQIKSPAFENENFVPEKYTCDGSNINPSFEFIDVPEETKSLVFIMDDPDAPRETFVHWLLFNINPKVKKIEEDSFPEGATQGHTSLDDHGYIGPCPPSGVHRYYFKLYALDTIFTELSEEADKEAVEMAMEGHILAEAEIMGLYGKRLMRNQPWDTE